MKSSSTPTLHQLLDGGKHPAMQALVIAHAAYGHNSFFKGNYLFRMWTDASSIIDYLVYARTMWLNAKSVMAWMP
jgi:stage V sporulation protein R